MKSRPSPSMVVALVALFIALAGTAIGGPTKTKSLPPNSVGAKQLKPGAVTAPDIAPKAVGANAIGRGAVLSSALAPGSVTSTALAPAAVTTPAIAPAAVDTGKLKDGAVESGKLKDGAVDSGKIKDGAVVAPKIGDEAVGSTQISQGSIIAAKIAAGAVTSGKLGDGAVTKPKIDNGAVGTSQLEADAVTAPKIGPAAVTQLKLGTSSVGTQQLSNAIPSASAFKNTNSTWTNNSYTAMHFPSETFDTANLHGAADYRMKAPVAGIYQATVVATWKNDGCGGTRSLEFDGRRADDSTPFLPDPYIASTVVANPTTVTTQSLTGMIQLAAGESLEIWGGAGGMSCGTTETIGNPAASVTMTFIAPGPA